MHHTGLWQRGFWLAAFALAAITCQAQEFRATLTGQVTDPSGALIPDASVTAVNIDSGTTYEGKTTGKGVYYINYVLPGNYNVVAEARL